MKKIIYGAIVILLFFLSVSYVYTHFEELKNYWNNEDWKLIEVLDSISINNYFTIDGNASNLIVVGNNYLHGYAPNGKENFDINVSLKNAITATEGDYCIVGEKDASNVYMINSNAKIWELSIEGTILDVSVNKNGYATITYKQVGYKSLIKVIKPDGEELFTTYLASTYAVDVEVSNDNKTLAIAELYTDGVKVEAIVELVNMSDLASKNSEKITFSEDTLITNIKYDSKNRLVVQTDKNIFIVEDGELNVFVEDFFEKTKMVSIENPNNPITIDKVENGLFDTKYILKIYSYKTSQIGIEEYQIEESPSIVEVQDDKIAMLLEKELLVVNSNGKLIKKYDVLGNIKAIKIYNDGNSLVVVYRDKIEFMKI